MIEKEHKNIDQLFKSELSGMETAVPFFAKENIDKALIGKKRFLLFFFTIFGLGIIGLIVFFSSQKSIQPTQHISSTSIKNEPLKNELNSNTINTTEFDKVSATNTNYTKQIETSNNNSQNTVTNSTKQNKSQSKN